MVDYKLNAKSGSYEVKESPVTLIHTLKYVKRNPLLLAVAFVLTFGAPFLGLVLVGVPGLIVGLVLAIICWFLSPLTLKRVIERRIR
jgi:hypothetical protein